MAGFNFEISCTVKQRDLVKALLRKTQNIGKSLECKIEYNWSNKNDYCVVVDGRLPNLQILAISLYEKLIPFAEGYSKHFTVDQRRTIAQKIIINYIDTLEYVSEHIIGLVDMFKAIPNSLFFDSGRSSHLKGKLDGFTRAIMMYRIGRITADQFTEEAHTIIELLLKNILEKHFTFSKLVSEAMKLGYLKDDHKRSILELNELRKQSKHKGQSISDDKMLDLLPNIVESVQILTQMIRLNSA